MSEPSTALVPVDEERQYMPALSITSAVSLYKQMNAFVAQVMKQDVDFGSIPGTKSKPTLLKPGAEKLCKLFGLKPKLFIVHKDEDWIGERHGGEPFFYYVYTCQLKRGDEVIAEADGSCNSWESKYRWRQGERKCPVCGKSAIIAGKAEFGGGFLCWKKKDGCNAKFPENDARITGQSVGRVPNPDVADLVNTLQKMAAKRALTAACLLGTSASEFFTQDVVEDEDHRSEPEKAAEKNKRPEPPQVDNDYQDAEFTEAEPPKKINQDQIESLIGIAIGKGYSQAVLLASVSATFGVKELSELTDQQWQKATKAVMGWKEKKATVPA